MIVRRLRVRRDQDPALNPETGPNPSKVCAGSEVASKRRLCVGAPPLRPHSRSWLALRRRPEHKGYTLSDSFGSLSMGVGFLVLDAGWRILGLGFLAWVWQFRAFDIEPTTLNSDSPCKKAPLPNWNGSALGAAIEFFHLHQILLTLF